MFIYLYNINSPIGPKINNIYNYEAFCHHTFDLLFFRFVNKN